MANVETKRRAAATKCNINDHSDVLVEILTRLDDRSLGVAACVCRLWCSVTRTEAFWEKLCFRQSSPRVRQVVLALGGYKKLYMVCVRRRRAGSDSGWSGEEVQLWLSLFCIDCYERLGRGDGLTAATPSLMFLCEPVNV